MTLRKSSLFILVTLIAALGEIPEKSNGPKKAIMYVTKIN